jgi:hypothetical protein
VDDRWIEGEGAGLDMKGPGGISAKGLVQGKEGLAELGSSIGLGSFPPKSRRERVPGMGPSRREGQERQEGICAPRAQAEGRALVPPGLEPAQEYDV